MIWEMVLRKCFFWCECANTYTQAAEVRVYGWLNGISTERGVCLCVYTENTIYICAVHTTMTTTTIRSSMMIASFYTYTLSVLHVVVNAYFDSTVVRHVFLVFESQFLASFVYMCFFCLVISSISFFSSFLLVFRVGCFC